MVTDTTKPSEEEFLLKCRDVLEYLYKFVGDDRTSVIIFRYFWGRGTAKLTIPWKGNTYVGERGDSDYETFCNFVEGLHKQLVREEALPWYKETGKRPDVYGEEFELSKQSFSKHFQEYLKVKRNEAQDTDAR